jgi:hypothetical protein
MAKKNEPEKPSILPPDSEPSLLDPNKPCNWRSTMSGFAGICGGLAGFSVAFVALLLTRSVADLSIGVASLTFGEIAVLLFGIAAGLFVGASEFLLHATGFDVYVLPERYYTKYQKTFEHTDYLKQQNKSLHDNYRFAKLFYNAGIFLVFIGLFFAIRPYNLWIATIVTVFGLVVELIQVVRTGQPSSNA